MATRPSCIAVTNERLVRVVGTVVGASEALIEDACAFAWMQLVGCQPERATAFAWLRTVAIREAWRLSRVERREARLDAPAGDQDGESVSLVELVADRGASVDDGWKRGLRCSWWPGWARGGAVCSRCRSPG